MSANTEAPTPSVAASSRSGKILQNSLWNLLGSGLPLIAVVFFVPYLLTGLGSARFGLLSLILALLAYANVLNLGLGKAITQRVSRAIADGTRDQVVNPSVWSAVVSQLLLGLVGTAILFVAAGPLVDALSFAKADQSEALWSLRLLGVVIPVILIGTSFRGLLEAAERFDLITAVEAPMGLLNYSLPALAVALGQGVTSIVGYLLVCESLSVLAMVYLSSRIFPEMRRRPRGSKADLKALVSFGGWIAISDLVFPMFTYVDRFLVGALAGVGRLPLYVIPHEIINRLWLVPTSLTAAVFPAASAIDRKADAERLAHLYAHGLRLMALATIPGAGVLALFAHDIIDVWISPEFADEAAPLLRIFALGLVINSSAMLASALIQGQGMPKLRAAIHLVEIPGYVVAAVVLVPKYGLVGAAWAWTIRMAITAVVIQFLLRSRLGLGRRILITHNVHVVAAPLVAFFVACLVLGPHMGFGPRVALAAAGAAVAGGTWRWVVHQDRHSADDSASVPTAK